MRIKFILFSLLLLCSTTIVRAQKVSLVPLPASMEAAEGEFIFGKRLTVKVDGYASDSLMMVVDDFAATLKSATGIKIKRVKSESAGMTVSLNSEIADEGYRLNVSPEKIAVEVSSPAGLFYALQTIKQMMPRNVLAGIPDNSIREWSLPAVKIADEPRFGWRGFMLDEGRHFYGKEAVKKIIDVMAAYKMNRFHWHLTEDQGWRIEIKKYPRLTEVGAWRDSKVLGWGDTKPDGIRYGGFYTHEDIKEVVEYARRRFIEIVPEIDIPGHSQAAVASYPGILACDIDNHHEVWLWQGVSADVINVADPNAVRFAKDVIDELTELFPFGYIHLGGDECPTAKWERNKVCREQLAEIGSSNYRDLQINFYRQLKEHIAAKPKEKQRKLIFWNEVLHGNTAPLGTDITIMAWIGADRAAADAAKRGMTTILTPQIPYYINRRQSPLPTEPRSQGHGTETVEAVYKYLPMNKVEQGLQQQYLGVQANFWTEWVEDASTVEYLMFPRLAAVAEAGWTPAERREYGSFVQRIQCDTAYYRLKGVNYGKHIFKGSHAGENQ